MTLDTGDFKLFFPVAMFLPSHGGLRWGGGRGTRVRTPKAGAAGESGGRVAGLGCIHRRLRLDAGQGAGDP